MKKIKTITAACLAALMLLLGTVTAAASDYSSLGVTFTVPDKWISHGVDWDFYKNNGYYSYAVSRYKDGLIEYAVEFKTDSDEWMKFGAKDLFASTDSKEHKREEYQTEDFLNELLAAGHDETAETAQTPTRAATDDSASADEAAAVKRVVTGTQDEFYLIAMQLLGTPELITVGGLQFIYQHNSTRDIYSHVHNDILYQFRGDNADQETMHKILASVSFSTKQTVIPTTPRTNYSSSRKKSSSSSGGYSPMMFVFFIGAIFVAGIRRIARSKKYDGEKKVNYIKLIEPTESSGDDDHNDEADENDDES